MSDTLRPGEVLNRGQSLVSNNGQYHFVQQDDGNLVLYKAGESLWASGTNGVAVEKCVMQGDGNLVLYRYNGEPVWASNTAGKPGAYLVAQDDGNVVIYYDPPVEAVWATNTPQ